MTDDSNENTPESIGDPTEFFLGLMQERTPERRDELTRVFEHFGVHFEINDEAERCFFSSAPATGKIIVGLKGACRLLGHCCSYVGSHYRMCACIKALAQGEIPQSGNDKETQALSKLLLWAVSGDIQSKVGSIEEMLKLQTHLGDVSLLIEAGLPEKVRGVAAEVFANALVWILYHELSHMQLSHVVCDGSRSLEQEREADLHAAEWMLSSNNLTSSDLAMRQWGVASALGWLTASCAFLGAGTQLTHPAAYDRLFQTINQLYFGENDDVWYYVQCMIILHILLADLAFNEDQIGPPLKHNASLLIDVIAAVGRN